MPGESQKRQIVLEAARLLYSGRETDWSRARLKAARRVIRGRVDSTELPAHREIRNELQRVAWEDAGEAAMLQLRDLRLEAIRLLRLLSPFQPRAGGAVLSPAAAEYSPLTIDLIAPCVEDVCEVLAAADREFSPYPGSRWREAPATGHSPEVLAERNDSRVPGDATQERETSSAAPQPAARLSLTGRFTIELRVVLSATGTTIPIADGTGSCRHSHRGMSAAELECLLQAEFPGMELEDELQAPTDTQVDRFTVYRRLLLPLADVAQRPRFHPEGDALYHSLQVFDLASEQRPWDEEFLTAALLHDVGKAIDPLDHTAAGLDSLEGWITPRTAWFIEHHRETHSYVDGTLGARARRRLQQSDDWEELKLLGQCDRAGRVPGVRVPEVEEALAGLRELEQLCG